MCPNSICLQSVYLFLEDQESTVVINSMSHTVYVLNSVWVERIFGLHFDNDLSENLEEMKLSVNFKVHQLWNKSLEVVLELVYILFILKIS